MSKPKKKPEPRKICIFCDNTANSGEHIWSDWLEALLPAKGKDTNQEFIEVRDQKTGLLKPPSTRKTSNERAISRKLKVVCESCNNGWMSRLETAVKPILTPLVTGNLALDLSVRAQQDLVNWLVLKNLVIENGAVSKISAMPIYSKKDRLPFKDSLCIPDGFRIWIGKGIGAQWRIRLFRHAVPMFLIPPMTSFNGLPNVQTLSFGIGRFFAFIFATTEIELYTRIKLLLDSRWMVPVWPPNSGSIVFPPQFALSDDDIRATSKVLDTFLASFRGRS